MAIAFSKRNRHTFTRTMLGMSHIDEILGKLTIEEKISLLSATDWWRTPVIDRSEVFVPHIKVCVYPDTHHQC